MNYSADLGTFLVMSLTLYRHQIYMLEINLCHGLCFQAISDYGRSRPFHHVEYEPADSPAIQLLSWISSGLTR